MVPEASMSEAPDRVASQSETWLVAAEIGVGQDEPLRADELTGLQEQTQGDVSTLRSPAGVFGYVSPASPATVGWDPVELIGLMADDFVHPEDLPAARACRDAALRSRCRSLRRTVSVAR